MPLTGPLSDALRQNRQTFNAKFAAATKAETPIDAAEFQHFLAATLDPIVRTAAVEVPERTGALVDALFDLSLDLFRHKLLGPGARHPAISDAWQSLLPQIPKFVARDPWRVAGSVTNALYNLSRTPGARPQDWCANDFKLCQTIDEFLDAGIILAWRCGMPQYRHLALEKVRALPTRLAAHTLGLASNTRPEQIADALRNLANNPWLLPQNSLQHGTRQLKIVQQAGAFRGFGGQFLTPPRALRIAGDLIATDGDTAWCLCADASNAVLIRAEKPASKPIASEAEMRPNGTLRWQGLEHRFPELAGATSIANTNDTVAVTIATSHHIFLIGLA